MNISPGDAPCLGEDWDECLLILGELGGIDVTEQSLAGTLAEEDSEVTSM